MIASRISNLVFLFALVVPLLLSTHVAAQTCDTVVDMMPTDVPRIYIPMSGVSAPLPGSLELSSIAARYEMLEGEMQLEYVGQMSPNGSGETDNAAVYRIKNAEAFFGLGNNKRWARRGLVLWLTVKKRAASVRVGWLDIEDWRKYRPDILGLRLAQSYCLPISPAPGF